MRRKWKKNAAIMAAVTMMTASTLSVSAEGVKDVFDAKFYADTYPDLKAAFGYDENALYQHYLKYGLAEGRVGSATFNVVEYRKAYADLEAAFGNDWNAYVDHYFKYGKAEGRTAGTTGVANTAAAAGSRAAAPVQTSASYIQHGSKFYSSDWTPIATQTMNEFNGNETYITCSPDDGMPGKLWVNKEITITDNDYWKTGSGAPEGYEIKTLKVSVRNRIGNTIARRGTVNALLTGDFDHTKWLAGWDSDNVAANSINHTESSGSSYDIFTLNYNGVQYTNCSASINKEYGKFQGYPYLSYNVSVCLPKGCNDFAVKLSYPQDGKTIVDYIPMP